MRSLASLSKSKIIFGSVVTYGTTVYCSYKYFNSSNKGSSKSKGKKSGDCDCQHHRHEGSSDGSRYDQIASEYDSKINMDEFVMGVKAMRWALIGGGARGDVLEVGGGTGRNLAYYNFTDGGSKARNYFYDAMHRFLSSPRKGGDGPIEERKEHVTRLVITDKSKEMVEVAQQKVEGMPLVRGVRVPISTDVGDSADLSRFGEGSFDTVLDTFGLCSFQDPVKVLQEMQRVCRADGRILLMEHGRTNKWAWLDRVLDDGHDHHLEEWGCEWNKDIDKIVEESGMIIDWKMKFHFGTTYIISARPRK